MTDTEVVIDRETFNCSICLNLLKDPVTIPCGHSYCMSCVDSHWDEEEDKQSYSCPQCRHSFTRRPVLVKNTMLVILMERLNKCEPPAAALCPSAAHGYVFCDLCSERKVRAVKSCLQCLVSYCKEHLQPHYDVAALKKHKLVEPTENIQENICSEHNEVMKMFCRTDQQCICYLCSVDQHKEHDTVTAAAERAEKQRELQAFQQDILQRLDHKNRDVFTLQRRMFDITESADLALEEKETKLKVLTRLLENRMIDVKLHVRSQKEAEEHRIKELQNKVQFELMELKETLTALDTLSYTFGSVSEVCDDLNALDITETPLPFLDLVTTAVADLKHKLQQRATPEIAPHEEFLQYTRHMTLDRNTAHLLVHISDKDRRAQYLHNRHGYIKHPDRFTQCCQVLCKEPLTGRCYVELLMGYSTKAMVALTYKDIDRDGPICTSRFGKTKSSWALVLCGKLHKIKHNNKSKDVVLDKRTKELGIFLDHDAGTLAFYRVNRPPALIYEIRTTFTQPLYLGIGFENQWDFVELQDPKNKRIQIF